MKRKALLIWLLVGFICCMAMVSRRPMKTDAKTVNRYATKTVSLKNKANGKTLRKVKRNTRLRQIREGNTWAVIRYDGKRYVTKKKFLNAERLPSKKRSRYYINYLKTRGPVYWHDRKYTYYTSRLCPIWLLPAPGLHLDKDGIWCDKNDYIVLGSSIDNKVNKRVIATPFGKYGRVYDTGGYSTPGWLCDTAVNW